MCEYQAAQFGVMFLLGMEFFLFFWRKDLDDHELVKETEKG